MQWGTAGLLVWLTITFTSIIDLERAMWGADALSIIDWEKDDKTLPADFIQAIVTAVLTWQGNDFIETISCSPQIIESLPNIHDNDQVVCKSITTAVTESNSDSSSCPDPSWNLKCMTMSDWTKVQAEDQVITN